MQCKFILQSTKTMNATRMEYSEMALIVEDSFCALTRRQPLSFVLKAPTLTIIQVCVKKKVTCHA